jgi:hypothetical protein
MEIGQVLFKKKGTWNHVDKKHGIVHEAMQTDDYLFNLLLVTYYSSLVVKMTLLSLWSDALYGFTYPT